MTVNYSEQGYGKSSVNFTLKSLEAPAVRGSEADVHRVANREISREDYKTLKGTVKAIGVTERFQDVIRTFSVPEGETPRVFGLRAISRMTGCWLWILYAT